MSCGKASRYQAQHAPRAQTINRPAVPAPHSLVLRPICLLYTSSTLVGRFDLYDLLLRGDRSADHLVQAGDVVHVGPVGPQVCLLYTSKNTAINRLLSQNNVAGITENMHSNHR